MRKRKKKKKKYITVLRYRYTKDIYKLLSLSGLFIFILLSTYSNYGENAVYE